MKMKMIGAMIILTLGIIITGCGKSDIDTNNAKTNNAKSNNNINVKEAFEQAKIINENSHIDVELLGRPDESTGAASEGGLGDMVPPATYSEGGNNSLCIRISFRRRRVILDASLCGR